MGQSKTKAFFAYPSNPPSAGEVIRRAAATITSQEIVSSQTWEDCRVGGKIIIDEICKAIAQAELFCADLTGMNANVMFELGYAISTNRRVWLLLDPTYVDSKAQFEQLRILTTVGCARYSNSIELVNRFNHEHPYTDLENTLFEQAIKRNLSPTIRPTVLYLKSLHENEASIQITKSLAALQDVDIPVIIDDPKESAAQSLTWYGTQVYSATAVCCHLMNPASRIGVRLHNARHALVAGMAYGMSKSLLMLAEGDFLAPIDYRDLLVQYQSSEQARKHLESWKEGVARQFLQDREKQREHATYVRLATELKGLQIGEYVAEHEADRLVEDYFVHTSEYQEALIGNQVVFVGRKGSGKTANFLKLSSELRKRARNIVCVIKPVAYELQGLLNLFRKYKAEDTKGYVIESLWKFLILTEIANSAAESIRGLRFGAATPDEINFLRFLETDVAKSSGDFTVRLERCLTSILGVDLETGGIESTRHSISEALHHGEIGRLRVELGKVLSSHNRVAILIDNLDKAWDRQADFNALAEFLLGLLSAADRLRMDFKHSDTHREPVNVTLAVFLRSDIFHKLIGVAREPDKIRYLKLKWGDRELLLRLVEERFVSSHAGSVRPEELWTKYFCPKIQNVPTKEYFAARILPRPRDLLFFVKSAIAIAVNRNHALVTVDDVRTAEQQYSQFAFDSVLAEDGVTSNRLEDILYEFVGSNPVLTRAEISSKLSKIGISDADTIVELLCSVSFLGLETRKNHFRFVDEPPEYRKALTLANQLIQHRHQDMRFQIHSAFWSFLEVVGH